MPDFPSALPVATERLLSADEIQVIARLLWGDRHDAGADGLAAFLGINSRNALRLLSDEMRPPGTVSAELLEEFSRWLHRSCAPAAKVIREAWELPVATAG